MPALVGVTITSVPPGWWVRFPKFRMLVAVLLLITWMTDPPKVTSVLLKDCEVFVLVRGLMVSCAKFVAPEPEFAPPNCRAEGSMILVRGAPAVEKLKVKVPFSTAVGPE